MSRRVDYASMTEKLCRKCGQTKPVSEFRKYADQSAPITGWRYYCWCRKCSNEGCREYGKNNRPRRNARLRRWRKTNPTAARARDRRAKLSSKYGLTDKQAAALFARYDGMCWLCRSRPAKAIDHCHKTDRVRGALCHGCNSVVLARVDADPEYLGRVETYLSANA